MTTVLFTGGTGFVMSNAVKHLLETDPAARAVVLDLAPVEGAVAGFLEPVGSRVTGIQGDIRDRGVLDRVAREHAITHVVHAASVTHFDRWERENPAAFIDVNVMGTVNVLEWSRRLEGLRRFLYVSSGGVYGDPAPDSPAGPQPESGPFNPPELYPISKLAAEHIVRRYGELFGLDTVTVRLSGVFGPMERYTPGRVTMSMPYHMMRAVIEDRPFRVSAGTLEAGGDFLSAEDIAPALAGLLRRTRTRHGVYNIAFGRFTPVTELLDAFRETAPGFACAVVDEEEADTVLDPARRRARWNAYAIERITAELGWQPRTLAEQVRSYHDWVMIDPEVRCPATTGSPATAAALVHYSG